MTPTLGEAQDAFFAKGFLRVSRYVEPAIKSALSFYKPSYSEPPQRLVWNTFFVVSIRVSLGLNLLIFGREDYPEAINVNSFSRFDFGIFDVYESRPKGPTLKELISILSDPQKMPLLVGQDSLAPLLKWWFERKT